jgi:hypothetical protein
MRNAQLFLAFMNPDGNYFMPPPRHLLACLLRRAADLLPLTRER